MHEIEIAMQTKHERGSTRHKTFRSHRLRSLAGGSNGQSDLPRRRPASATIWITQGHGAACDACGKKIGADEAQYALIANGRAWVKIKQPNWTEGEHRWRRPTASSR